MLMSVAQSKLPWLAGLALLLGAGLKALAATQGMPGMDAPGDMLLGAGIAWGTVASKGESSNSGLFKDR